MKKLLLLLAIGSGLGTAAQSNLGLYHFDALPQNIMINPGSPQQTRFAFGIPAVSSVYFNLHNSGFTLLDLFEKGVDANTSIQRTIAKLDGTDHLSVTQQLELMHAGFSVRGKHYISFGAYQSTNILLDYPVDLMRFLFPENVSNQDKMDIDLSEFNYESLITTVIHVGYQYKFLDDRLTVGTRLKYYIGVGNTHLDRFNVAVSSTPEAMDITTDVNFRTAGVASAIDGDDFDVSNIFKNNGIGFDLGANYRINKRFSVSFSVLDLGVIKWNENLRDYVSKGQYTFRGVDYDLNDGNFDDAAEAISDSLEKALDFKEVDGQSFTRSVPTHYYLGGQFHLTPKSSFGVVYHGRTWSGLTKHNFGVNYVGRFSKWFQLMANYSVINGTYNNIGGGLSLNLAGLQIYVLSDNIYGAFKPSSVQNINFRLGVNVALYKKKDRLGERFFAKPLPLPPGEIPVDPSILSDTTAAPLDSAGVPVPEPQTEEGLPAPEMQETTLPLEEPVSGSEEEQPASEAEGPAESESTPTNEPQPQTQEEEGSGGGKDRELNKFYN